MASHKARGWDNILIKMTKTWEKTITKSFKECSDETLSIF